MRRKRHLPGTGKLLAAAGLWLCLAAGAQAADSWTLSAAEWSRPRSGAAVLEMKPVAVAVRCWQASEDPGKARLLLVHPGGEAGGLWAAELRDWLVALGVPPSAIEPVPGGQATDRLEIRLRE